MLQKIDGLLCKLRVHKWGLWAITEVPLFAQDNLDAIEDTSDLRIEVHTRCCERCGTVQDRRMFFW